ncbi:tRNA pseudouridine(38-40) synthase TruA [Leptospira sp. WS60.C2]
MPNYALLVEYDGTHFYGWQKQKDLPSVQNSIESAFAIVLKTNPHSHLSVAGRTDTGVHALGMVCNFKTEIPIPNFHKFLVSVNALTPDGVSVKNMVEVPAEFHSRFSCTGREYIYKLYYSKYESSFIQGRAYWVRSHVDWEKVKQQLQILVGEKDFRSLTKAKSMEGKRAVREIFDIQLEQLTPEWYQIRIRANGFMHNMVRITVGTLLDIGKGRWESRSIDSILEEKNRSQAGVTLPPDGLYFVRAYYEDHPEIHELYKIPLP